MGWKLHKVNKHYLLSWSISLLRLFPAVAISDFVNCLPLRRFTRSCRSYLCAGKGEAVETEHKDESLDRMMLVDLSVIKV